MVGLWWAVSRIARSNYADFSPRQQLSLESWSPFEPLCASQIMGRHLISCQFAHRTLTQLQLSSGGAIEGA
jgi:hypothetical protein